MARSNKHSIRFRLSSPTISPLAFTNSHHPKNAKAIWVVMYRLGFHPVTPIPPLMPKNITAFLRRIRNRTIQ